MFVMTAKLSKPKLIAAAVILIGVVAALVMHLTGKGAATPTLPKGDSHEARAAYLATYGWSIDANPKETQTVTIPDPADNRVFSRYNELQTNQGFDLAPYAGKEVTRYVYEILNYPEATAPVYAGILIYEGKIIGGEITDTSPKGVIHGFQKPGTTAPTDNTADLTTAPTESPEVSPGSVATDASSPDPSVSTSATESTTEETTAATTN